MKSNELELDKSIQWQGDNFDDCVCFCNENDTEKKIIGFDISAEGDFLIIRTDKKEYTIECLAFIKVINDKLCYYEIKKFFDENAIITSDDQKFTLIN
jgi:hypothetical protein